MSKIESYFQNLNYTSTNEDTLLELKVMSDLSDQKNVLSIAGSGARVLPLLAKTSEHLTCLDLSIEQLYLTELRLNLLKILTHQEYLNFWGYAHFNMNPSERKKIFKQCELTSSARQYLNQAFEQKGWSTLLYSGKFEVAMSKLGKLITCLNGECPSKKSLSKMRFIYALKLLGHPLIFDFLLYKGKHPRNNLFKSYDDYFFQMFQGLFNLSSNIEGNYFLQLIFKGEITSSQDLPAECDEEIYLEAKKNRNNITIDYRQENLFSFLKNSNHQFNFVSLSDIPSYFSPHEGENHLQLLKNHLYPNALVVSRYYLHRPTNIDSKNFQLISDQYKKEFERERTQVYITDIWKA